jgi:hypothetical protein
MVRPVLIFVGITLPCLHACTKGTAVAHNVTIDTIATTLSFAAPVSAPLGRYSLCLEFSVPGDSRLVSRMTVALHDSAGRADTLRGTPDRTGESTICLGDSTSRRYVGATITAPRRITLREVEWLALTK